ncbi:Hypothetical predicted protein [Prunus dulcis]|uniref:Uncharacterized protein n=1 Tax=Prunus dulcis TaxID=3755 RepID=A0A5E4GAN4_PRUDU|nr:Hypothetical predicted protein [Prunus dulcis]
MVDIEYEYLPEYYFVCGKIGHPSQALWHAEFLLPHPPYKSHVHSPQWEGLWTNDGPGDRSSSDTRSLLSSYCERTEIEDSISPSALPLHSIVFDAVASLQHQFGISAKAARTPLVSLTVPNASMVPVIPSLKDPIFQFSACHSPKRGCVRHKKGVVPRSASHMINAKRNNLVAPVSVSDTFFSGVDFMASKRLCIGVPSDKPMETGPVESPGSIP